MIIIADEGKIINIISVCINILVLVNTVSLNNINIIFVIFYTYNVNSKSGI